MEIINYLKKNCSVKNNKIYNKKILFYFAKEKLFLWLENLQFF